MQLEVDDAYEYINRYRYEVFVCGNYVFIVLVLFYNYDALLLLSFYVIKL